jgi:hypothetical protein
MAAVRSTPVGAVQCAVGGHMAAVCSIPPEMKVQALPSCASPGAASRLKPFAYGAIVASNSRAMAAASAGAKRPGRWRKPCASNAARCGAPSPAAAAVQGTMSLPLYISIALGAPGATGWTADCCVPHERCNARHHHD